MKHNKRAFTIVELVIVIAILAILAAVLIPTFVNLTKKANESNTMQLVKNMNTALKADMPDGKHPTMQSALDAANAFGYDLEKINKSKTDNEILWDSANDCFVYMKDGEAKYVPDSNLTVSEKDMKNQLYKYWTISTTINTNTPYSTYLYDYTGDSSITVSTGIDVGNVTTITKITYTSNVDKARDIVIRTNGATALEVNGYVDASNAQVGDVIAHYGEAGSVDIVKCAMASYHEYGKVNGTITVAKGHVDIEQSGSVGNINVTASSANDFAISNNKGGNLSFVKATNPDILTSDNVKVSEKTGIMTAENKDAVAYSESAGFLKTWNKTLGNGKTTLLKDLVGENYFVLVPAGVTAIFDLNGHEFETDESGKNTVYGKMTFMDSSADQSGLYYCNVDYAYKSQDSGILRAYGSEAILTIESGRIEARNGKGEFDNNSGQFGVALWEGATIIMNGGSIKTGWYSIVGNGTDNSVVSTIIINGGNLISVHDYALYLPHKGVTTINGGVVDGAAGAVALKRGTLTINGGSFMSDGTGDVGNWGDGTGSIGKNALIIVSKNNDSCTAFVNGGDYKVLGETKIFEIVNNTHSVNVTISSGTYNQNIEKWVSSPYECVDNGDGTWTVQKSN